MAREVGADDLLVVNGDLWHTIDVVDFVMRAQASDADIALLGRDDPRVNTLSRADGRLAGLRGRAVLAAFFLFGSVFSGCLSIGREAVSSYQLFSANACRAADWILKNTEKDSVFLTGQQHVNPVASLAGRQIICGSDLYVFFHGLDYRTQAEDCRRYYEHPDEYEDVLQKYHVDYVYVSDYERADFDVDIETIKEQWPLVYENGSVRIFRVNAEDS